MRQLPPRYQDYFEKTGDWVSLAWWIHENIPAYYEMCFFSRQCAFNIRWHENSGIGKTIKTFIANPKSGNKKNLITKGKMSREYIEKKINQHIRTANEIRTRKK